MVHKIVVVQEPACEFYKDEGGKGNMLHLQIKSPVPLDHAVTLKCSLYYESDQRVEDREQSILVLCKSEYTPYQLTPSQPEETIDFRIEKVSRRKDGQRFKIFVEPDYSGGIKSKVLLVGVLSEPINVMSKRKTGERIVSRRAPPRAAQPGFPGLTGLPMPAGIDLSSAPPSAGILSSSSLPFTFPAELACALHPSTMGGGGNVVSHAGGGSGTGAAARSGCAPSSVGEGSDPILKLVFIGAQMAQMHEMLSRIEKRVRLQDKRLARVEIRLGIAQGGDTARIPGGFPGSGGSVPLFPIPLSNCLSTDSLLMPFHQVRQDVSNGSSQGNNSSSDSGGLRPDVATTAMAAAGSSHAASAVCGPATASAPKSQQLGSAKGGPGQGSVPMQFATSLVDGQSNGVKGARGSGDTATPVTDMLSGSGTLGMGSSGLPTGLPPAWSRPPMPGGFGDTTSGPLFSGQGFGGLQSSLSMNFTGPYGMSGMGMTGGLPVNVTGLANILPGLQNFRRLRTTEMELTYNEGDLMAAGMGMMPSLGPPLTTVGGAGRHGSNESASFATSKLGGVRASSAVDSEDFVVRLIENVQEIGSGASRGASATPLMPERAAKRARVVVQEGWHEGDSGEGGRPVTTITTSDPSLAALAANAAPKCN